MFTKILNFITRWVTEYFPDVVLREGTGAYDLLAKAYSILHHTHLDTQDTVLSRLDPREYNNMSEAAMDRLAANWFLTRNQGDRSTGTVRIWFSEPTAVTIPVNFEVITGSGLVFYTNAAFAYSASQLESQKQGSLYYCDITVYAKNFGAEYNIGIGEIADIKSPFYLPWVSVSNQQPFTSGADRETNTEFYARVIGSVNTRNLLITKGSMTATLLESFPTLIEVETLGYGDDGMERDIIYGLALPNHIPYRLENFYMKTKGSNLYNDNIAYCSSMEFDTDGVGDPVPSSLSDIESAGEEVEQDDYDALARLDLTYYTRLGGIAYSETFDNDTGRVIYEFPDAYATDSGLPFGLRRYGDSVYISLSGRLVMGATPTTVAPID